MSRLIDGTDKLQRRRRTNRVIWVVFLATVFLMFCVTITTLAITSEESGPTPVPTATATSSKYVPSGPYAYRNLTPTAVPTPILVPQPASIGEGLGVSFRQFERAFPLDYQPGKFQSWDFWTADNGEWFWVELEGRSQDLTVARISMNLIDLATGLPVDSRQVAETLDRFVSVVLPDEGAIGWIDANLERVVDVAVKDGIGVAETSYGHRLVILQVFGGTLSLMVEAR